MRKVYQASFHLGEAGAKRLPSLSDVAAEVIRWAVGRDGVSIPAGLDPNEPLRDVAEVALGKDSTIEVAWIDGAEEHVWGLRLEHSDQNDDSVRWSTEVCIRGTASTMEFSCANSIGRRGRVVAPTPHQASRPRIVPAVIKRWGAFAGFPLLATGDELKMGAVADFTALLTDPRRTRPIVFISARNVDDRPVLRSEDVGKVADWLAGLAHVYVAEDRFPSLKMKDVIPPRFNCFDGSIRVYWPGLAWSDPPYRHPAWPAYEVASIQERFTHGFAQFLLGKISTPAIYLESGDAPSWEAIKRIQQRRRISSLSERAELGAVAEEIVREQDDVIRRLQAEADEAKAEVAELRCDLEVTRQKAQQWQRLYLEQSRGGESTAQQAAQPPVESVADAIESAEDVFGDRLVFALNGRSDHEHFERPGELLEALRWLATTHYEARVGTKSCNDLDVSIRETCGWWYKPHQSKLTMKKYEREYTTQYNGKKRWLAEHIGSGSGKDPRRTIRIAFWWDKDQQKIVVGYIGQHQETDAT